MPQSNSKKCIICGFETKKMAKTWYQCEYCGHLQDIMNPHADARMYNDAYYTHKEDDKQGLFVKDRTFWDLIHEYAPDVKTVIDYGCGVGHFFRSIPVEYDYQAVGYDPHRTEFNDKSILNNDYDMLVALHVMEHFDDPHDLLNAVNHKYFLFSIPWAGGDKISFGALWHWYTNLRPGEHKQLFTRKSLNIFLRDYDVLCEDYSDGKGQNPDHPEYIITQLRKRR